MVIDLLARQLRVYLLFPRFPNLAGWGEWDFLDYSERDVVAPYDYDRWLASIQATVNLPHLFDQGYYGGTFLVEDEFGHIVPYFHIGKLLAGVGENSRVESSLSSTVY